MLTAAGLQLRAFSESLLSRSRYFHPAAGRVTECVRTDVRRTDGQREGEALSILGSYSRANCCTMHSKNTRRAAVSAGTVNPEKEDTRIYFLLYGI